MDRDVLLRYFKHLDGLLAALERKEYIYYQDVAPIRSEFLQFRARAAQAGFVTPALRELVETVEVRIDDKHLEGSKKTKLLNFYAIIGSNSPFLRAWRAKNKEKIEPELARLRNEIRDLAHAVSLQ